MYFFRKKASVSFLLIIMFIFLIFTIRYLDRIIRGPQLQEFSNMLADHQKATTSDGKEVVCQLEQVQHLKNYLLHHNKVF